METVHYGNYLFLLIDTGGFEPEQKESMEQMRLQSQLAVQEADAIIFLTDAREGWTPDDAADLPLLSQSDKPVILPSIKQIAQNSNSMFMIFINRVLTTSSPFLPSMI